MNGEAQRGSGLSIRQRGLWLRLGVTLVLFFVVAGCRAERSVVPPETRSELRRARMAAFFFSHSSAAQLRLGRAKLAVWDREGAEEAFQKAARIDPRCHQQVGDAYFAAAKALVASRPMEVTTPIVARYVSEAARWSQRRDERAWYFAQIAAILPQMDPEQRDPVLQVAKGVDDANGGTGLMQAIRNGITEAAIAEDDTRWFALIEVADWLNSNPDTESRTWLANNYAAVAKHADVNEPKIARRSITRAQQLDVRFADDVELFDLMARLPDDGSSDNLTDMQRTANQMIQIIVAAKEYARQHDEDLPKCDSITSFVTEVQPYTTTKLSTTDAWGSEFHCSVPPHGLYVDIRSDGPDRETGRGESISAWDAMHITTPRGEADLRIEHGYAAPPWWSKADVLAMYR
jgi:hypothetical protein